MTLLELLQAADSSIAVAAGFIGTAVYTARKRRSMIEAMRKDLAIAWTNEGDSSSTALAEKFIHLQLELAHGELHGSLSLESGDALEVHVTPGCFSAYAEITLLLGRKGIPVASVRLALASNRNQLQWRVLRIVDADLAPFLPKRADLWPVPLVCLPTTH